MRWNIRNMMRQAADDLDALPAARFPMAGGYADGLRQFSESLAELGKAPERWVEFAQLWCLKPEDLR